MTFKDRKKLILLICFLIFFFVSPFAIYGESNFPKEEITAVVLNDFPPFYQLSNLGKPQGFAIDALEHIAKEAGFSVDYIIVRNWAQAMGAVRAGRADLVPGIGISSHREKEFLYTNSMEAISINFFVRKQNSYTEISDIGMGPVAVLKESIVINRLKDDYPNMSLKSFDNLETALIGLLSGSVEALVCPGPVLMKKAWEAQLDDRIKTLGKPLMEIKRAYLLLPENKVLVEALNPYIDSYRSSDQYRIDYLSWYGQPESFWTVTRMFWAMLIVVLTVLFVSNFWRSLVVGRINREMSQTLNDKNKAEEHLLMFKTITDEANFGSILVDPNGVILYSNDYYACVHGLNRAGLMGQIFRDLFSPDSVEKIQQNWKIVTAKGGRVGPIELMHLHSDGYEFPMLMTGVSIWNGDVLKYVTITALDITDKKNMEDQMKQSEKLQAIGQLAGGIAHDFNNALGGIMGAAGLLEAHLPDKEDPQDFFKLIMDSTNRAAELTRKLLAFARKQPTSLKAVGMHSLINDAVDIMTHTIDRRITITTKLDSEADRILGDSSALEGIIINLCINASHAIHGEGDISIRSESIILDELYCSVSAFDITPGDFIKIQVRDNGKGISREDLPKIFDPFFTTKDVGKGTGLGLSSVYGAVKTHKGAITVYTEVGFGTVFYILLPINTEDIIEIEKDNCACAFGCYGRILLVEDEEVLRVTAKAIMENAGFEVQVAEDGETGLQYFRDHHGDIDAVVLDMLMPRVNGRDCFFGMKEIDPDVKAVVTTGFSSDDDISEMQKNDLSAVIQKPYSRNLLCQTVKGILDD